MRALAQGHLKTPAAHFHAAALALVRWYLAEMLQSALDPCRISFWLAMKQRLCGVHA